MEQNPREKSQSAKIIESLSPNQLNFVSQNWPGIEPTDFKKIVTVTEYPVLGYRKFSQKKEGETQPELLLADEAAEILARSDQGSIKELKTEINKIIKDPFGPSSIDSQINSERHKIRRSVNALSPHLEEKLGVSIAVKGSVELSEENLLAQFQFMRQCEKEWEKLPPDVKEVLKICRVYAAARFALSEKKEEKAIEEVLVMERIADQKQVKNDRIGANRVKGFSIAENPMLARIVETYLPDYSTELKVLSEGNQECYMWSSLAKALQSLGLNLSDLHGRNVFYYETSSGEKSYTIIDQKHKQK